MLACSLSNVARSHLAVASELRIIGSRCGPFPPALELLKSGLDLTPLITATFPLKEVQEALTLASTKGTMKVRCAAHTPHCAVVVIVLSPLSNIRMCVLRDHRAWQVQLRVSDD